MPLNDSHYVGKPLAEVAPDLYAEVRAGLAARDFSPAGCVPEPDETERLLNALSAATVSGRCACGGSNCATYSIAVPEKERAVSYHTLRIIAPGDLQVHFDSDGDISEVERLYPEEREGTWSVRII